MFKGKLLADTGTILAILEKNTDEQEEYIVAMEKQEKPVFFINNIMLQWDTMNNMIVAFS